MRLRRSTKRNERGVVLVEAALVLPVVVLLILGVLEGALLVRTYLSSSNAADSGARDGSIVGSSNTSDYFILQSVAHNASAMAKSDILWVVVYHASSSNDPVPTNCTTRADAGLSGINTICNIYHTADLQRPETDFGPGGFGGDQYWAPQSRAHGASTGSDYLGVAVKTQCSCMAMSLFQAHPTLHATSVVRIETDRL